MCVNVSNFYQSDNLIELNVNKADYTLKKLKLNVKSLEGNVLKPLKFIDIHILQIQYFKEYLFMKASSNDTRYIKFCSTTKMIAKSFVSIIIHIQKIPFYFYHTSKEFLLFSFSGRIASICEGSFHCCGSIIKQTLQKAVYRCILKAFKNVNIP